MVWDRAHGVPRKAFRLHCEAAVEAREIVLPGDSGCELDHLALVEVLSQRFEELARHFGGRFT